MKKKITLALSLIGLSCIAVGLTACKSKTLIDENRGLGYKISVSYNANGGSFLNRSGVTIVDMFNPDDYEKDENGAVHIKLTEPTNESRPTSVSDKITLTRSEYFFAGWYQEREVREEDGVPVDDSGRALKQAEDGSYVYADTEEAATPAYVYSGYWDFEEDRIDYTEGDGTVSITLYAGWVPYYEFDYYYKEDGVWTLYGKTTFDYKTTNAENSSTSDKDTIWLPDWADGAMGYTHTYANNSIYTFPSLPGKTFSKAYKDADCLQEIVGSLEHEGTLDVEHAEAKDRIQNVYVVFEEGDRFRIDKAEQLVKNANTSGIYEILADLDFTGLTWPATFEAGVFKGEMRSSEGQTYKLSNITATHSSSTIAYGGVFGEISKEAKIENLIFENITYDLATGTRMQGSTFGLFAGFIEDGAGLDKVTVVGGTFRIGAVTLGSDYSINLCANGDREKVECDTTGVHLQIYGKNLYVYYYYEVNPTSVEVDEEGNVTVTFERSNESSNYDEIYNIQ